MVAWVCVAVLASSVALVRTYDALAKPGDWIRATAYLQAHEQPGQPIVVFQAENSLPLLHYYRGSNRVVPIPAGVDFRRYDVSRFVIRDPAMLERVVPTAPKIWLVTAGECASANIQFGCDALAGFVARHYRVESSASFYGSQVQLLARRGG